MSLQTFMSTNPGFFFLMLGCYLIALCGIIFVFVRGFRWAIRKGISEGIEKGIVLGAKEILRILDERKKSA